MFGFDDWENPLLSLLGDKIGYKPDLPQDPKGDWLGPETLSKVHADERSRNDAMREGDVFDGSGRRYAEKGRFNDMTPAKYRGASSGKQMFNDFMSWGKENAEGITASGKAFAGEGADGPKGAPRDGELEGPMAETAEGKPTVMDALQPFQSPSAAGGAAQPLDGSIGALLAKRKKQEEEEAISKGLGNMLD
jgi:hypothetical protein